MNLQVPPGEYFSESEPYVVLQETISKLENMQQNESLAPGVRSLVKMVWDITKVISVSISQLTSGM